MSPLPGPTEGQCSGGPANVTGDLLGQGFQHLGCEGWGVGCCHSDMGPGLKSQARLSCGRPCRVVMEQLSH